jgi:hypothetical protein
MTHTTTRRSLTQDWCNQKSELWDSRRSEYLEGENVGNSDWLVVLNSAMPLLAAVAVLVVVGARSRWMATLPAAAPCEQMGDLTTGIRWLDGASVMIGGCNPLLAASAWNRVVTSASSGVCAGERGPQTMQGARPAREATLLGGGKRGSRRLGGVRARGPTGRPGVVEVVYCHDFRN